jgi:hypothetical protein
VQQRLKIEAPVFGGGSTSDLTDARSLKEQFLVKT